MRTTRVITIVLSVFVFVFTMSLMIKPAYTNPTENAAQATLETKANESDNVQIEQTESETKIENKDNNFIEKEIPKNQETQVEFIETNLKEPEETICMHNNTIEKIIKYATCTNSGKKQIICDSCGEIIDNIKIEIKNHDFKKEKIEATCSTNGLEYEICKVCQYKTNEKETEKLAHEYSVTKNTYATPYENGEKIMECKICGFQQLTTVIYEPASANSIYIPTANINKSYTIGKCDQENTDKNDITIDYNFINANNPVIFGHNTRTLGKLHNTNVGDYIYIIENGEISTYRVTHSEPGTDVDGGTNIKGLNTGKLCIENSSTKTLHFFTCYWHPMYGNIRWIVIAEIAN